MLSKSCACRQPSLNRHPGWRQTRSARLNVVSVFLKNLWNALSLKELWDGTRSCEKTRYVLRYVNGASFTAVTRVQIPSGTPNLFRNLRAAEIFLGTKKHKLERISFDHQHGCTRVDLFLTESKRARRRVRIESS